MAKKNTVDLDEYFDLCSSEKKTQEFDDDLLEDVEIINQYRSASIETDDEDDTKDSSSLLPPQEAGSSSRKLQIAKSWIATVKCSSGSLRERISACKSSADIFFTIDASLASFTDSKYSAQLARLGNAQMVDEIIVSWLTEIVECFGREILLDAGVIMLQFSEFSVLGVHEKINYFTKTLAKVRNWYKELRKKLKRIGPPQ